MLSSGAEPEVLAIFRLIQEQIGIWSFWDVGANMDYYSWLIKNIQPKAKVRMFEPETGNVCH